MHYLTDVLKKYAVFTGRASRKEYWMFYLWYVIVYILILIAGLILDSVFSKVLPFEMTLTLVLLAIYVLVFMVPSFSVAMRRLHDISKSGWWVLISFVPLIGAIWLIVLLAEKSTPGANEYGPSLSPVTMEAPTPSAASVATPATETKAGTPVAENPSKE